MTGLDPSLNIGSLVRHIPVFFGGSTWISSLYSYFPGMWCTFWWPVATSTTTYPWWLTLSWVFFFFVFVVYFFVFVFLGPHPRHIEVPKEQQLLAYTTATATWVPSLISDLYNSLLQHGILNLPIKARNRTWVLMDTSRVCYRWAEAGTPTLSCFTPHAPLSHNLCRLF